MARTWVARLLHSALKIQYRFAPMVPVNIKQASAGRKGRLVIEGEDGGIFYLRWTGSELIEEDNPDDVRNDFVMHSQTLLDIATGELGVREAIAARLITVSGDRSIYDTEDIMALLEQLQLKITKVVSAKVKEQ